MPLLLQARAKIPAVPPNSSPDATSGGEIRSTDLRGKGLRVHGLVVPCQHGFFQYNGVLVAAAVKAGATDWFLADPATRKSSFLRHLR